MSSVPTSLMESHGHLLTPFYTHYKLSQDLILIPVEPPVIMAMDTMLKHGAARVTVVIESKDVAEMTSMIHIKLDGVQLIQPGAFVVHAGLNDYQGMSPDGDRVSEEILPFMTPFMVFIHTRQPNRSTREYPLVEIDRPFGSVQRLSHTFLSGLSRIFSGDHSACKQQMLAEALADIRHNDARFLAMISEHVNVSEMNSVDVQARRCFLEEYGNAIDLTAIKIAEVEGSLRSIPTVCDDLVTQLHRVWRPVLEGMRHSPGRLPGTILRWGEPMRRKI